MLIVHPDESRKSPGAFLACFGKREKISWSLRISRCLMRNLNLYVLFSNVHRQKSSFKCGGGIRAVSVYFRDHKSKIVDLRD